MILKYAIFFLQDWIPNVTKLYQIFRSRSAEIPVCTIHWYLDSHWCQYYNNSYSFGWSTYKNSKMALDGEEHESVQLIIKYQCMVCTREVPTNENNATQQTLLKRIWSRCYEKLFYFSQREVQGAGSVISELWTKIQKIHTIRSNFSTLFLYVNRFSISRIPFTNTNICQAVTSLYFKNWDWMGLQIIPVYRYRIERQPRMWFSMEISSSQNITHSWGWNAATMRKIV